MFPIKNKVPGGRREWEVTWGRGVIHQDTFDLLKSSWESFLWWMTIVQWKSNYFFMLLTRNSAGISVSLFMKAWQAAFHFLFPNGTTQMLCTQNYLCLPVTLVMLQSKMTLCKTPVRYLSVFQKYTPKKKILLTKTRTRLVKHRSLLLTISLCLKNNWFCFMNHPNLCKNTQILLVLSFLLLLLLCSGCFWGINLWVEGGRYQPKTTSRCEDSNIVKISLNHSPKAHLCCICSEQICLQNWDHEIHSCRLCSDRWWLRVWKCGCVSKCDCFKTIG